MERRATDCSHSLAVVAVAAAAVAGLLRSEGETKGNKGSRRRRRRKTTNKISCLWWLACSEVKRGGMNQTNLYFSNFSGNIKLYYVCTGLVCGAAGGKVFCASIYHQFPSSSSSQQQATLPLLAAASVQLQHAVKVSLVSSGSKSS
jgi:hypothetical protein